MFNLKLRYNDPLANYLYLRATAHRPTMSADKEDHQPISAKSEQRKEYMLIHHTPIL